MDSKMKPIKRSKLRLFLGKTYYTTRKHISWKFSKNNWAKQEKPVKDGHLIFKHKTPLRRNLKDVDAYIDDRKIVNLSIAIKSINHLTLHPGQVFSYWKLIGKPTASKGYVQGMVLDHGRYKLGVGGGLCQLSNLIFWMVCHSPLETLERHRHSYDVFPDAKRTQPFGSGATCVYNYRDLQVFNPSQESYQIRLWLDDQYLHGEIWSNKEKYFNYEVYEASHHISLEYWGGYLRHNSIHRRVYDLSNHLMDDHFLYENHAIMMYSPLLNPPKDFTS